MRTAPGPASVRRYPASYALLAPVVTRRLIAEFARALHVTMATAKTYVGRLLAGLGARDQAQLVMVAHETGLVQPG